MRNITTIKIIPELRTIKPKGADIEEALIYFNNDAQKLKDHIIGRSSETPQTTAIPTTETTRINQDDRLILTLDDFVNRRCLGVADDKQAYFIDASGRLESCRLRGLNKNILMTYLPLSEWKMYYKAEKSDRIEWDDAVNDVMIASRNKDFDPDSTLGRGAWRRSDGALCYHDGIDTIGKLDPSKIYLRKMKKDIGITGPTAGKETCQAIGMIALDMTFESKLDAVRCLSWSCLSPFAGALPWRPAILLTGSSESGKTTIINNIITAIGQPEFFNGAETTPAYLRAKMCNDSCGVVFDETEGGEKAQKNRQELFLVMRQSTSDDAPKVGKSNKDQGVVEYNMKNMFLFSSIHAGIDDEADEKRILRVNLKKTKQHEIEWDDMEKRIEKYITPENCRAIRALTWKKLPDIIAYAKIVRKSISKITQMSSRSAYAEALIISCYFLIWRGMDITECTEDVSEAMIASIYEAHEIEDRNEPAETLNKLLDSIVFLPEKHENRTLKEMLFKVRDKTAYDSDKKEYIETLDRYGLKYISDDDIDQVAVQKDNSMIKKLLETGNGYNKILWRHKDCINKSRRVRMSGSPRTCVMIGGVFKYEACDFEEIPI